MNHGDAAPLSADGIVPASFFSRGARLLQKKKKKYISTLPFFLLWHFMPRRQRSVSPSPPRRCPSLCHRPQRLTVHQFLHCLRAQRLHIAQLIVVYGPSHRIEFSLSRQPGVLVVAPLIECLDLQDLFWTGNDARFLFPGEVLPGL